MAQITQEKLNDAGIMLVDSAEKFRIFMQYVLGLTNEDFHDKLDDDIDAKFDSTDPLQKFFSVITLPRDHGKSKHLSIGYPLYRIAKDHNVRILSISRTAGVAESFLSEVVSNIERNPIYKTFAKFIDPKHRGVIPRLKAGKKRATEDWSGKSITIEREDVGMKDATITATGLFGQILSRRADIIILDDVVDQQNSETELQRKKVIDWIETTVIPVLVPGGTLIYVGNTWHQEDVVSRFLRDPRFQVQVRMGAIEQEAERQDLWSQWVNIKMNVIIPSKERNEKAKAFYESNRVEMDKGWKTLWPTRYPYADLFFIRRLNPYVFARMYQCDPSNRPNQTIRDEWIEVALSRGANLRFQDLPHPKNIIQASAAGMDLAISEESASDDTALLYADFVRSGYDGVQDGDYLVRQIYRGKFTPKEQRTKAKESVFSHGMMSIRVESNAYQRSLSIDLQEENVPVTAYTTGGEKFDPEIGINMIANIMENGKMVIPYDITDQRTAELATQLANEMRAFEPGVHTGDSLMGLWFAVSELREIIGTRYMFAGNSTLGIKDSPPVHKAEERVVAEKNIDAAMVAEQEYERSRYSSMMRDRLLNTLRRK